MKTVLGIIGSLLILSGVVWFFQGIGVIPGSFMTGQDFWAVAGFLAVIAGLVMVRYWRRKEPISEAAASRNPEQNHSEPEA